MSNTVLVCGSGDCGQLGLGDEITARKKPAVVSALVGKNVEAIFCGGLHNVVKTKEGKLWTWGCNDDLALGQPLCGAKTDDGVCKKIKHDGPCSGADDSEYEFGAHQVKALDDVKIAAVSCGDCHTACVDDKGTLYTWGTYKDSAGPMGFDAKVSKQDAPRVMDFFKKDKVCEVDSGTHHTVAITSAGKLYSWGAGEEGQLGHKVLQRHKRAHLAPRQVIIKAKRRSRVKAKKVFCGAMHTFVMSDDEKMYCWGLNNFGQCGFPESDALLDPVPVLEDVNVAQVACGQNHTLVLTTDGKVLSFGRGDYGQLGHGNTEHLDAPKEISYFAGKKIVSVAAGYNHSLAVDSNRQAYAWGFGDMLQLGNGEDGLVTLPRPMDGKQLETRGVLQAAAGAQHTLLLAADK